MFNRDPEKTAQRMRQREQKRQERSEHAAQRLANKQACKEWRLAHPAETTMKIAATLRAWPSSEFGMTQCGPVLGGKAEFVNVDAHKAWTATRLVSGVATVGMSAALTGRKNKGAAVINVTFGNGAAQTYNVTPETSTLRAANQYVTAFNALATQLATEAGHQ